MKMGKRRNRGGTSPLTAFERNLRRHIELYTSHTNHATADEIVTYLRSTLPEYNRHKLHPFTRTVEKTLDRMKSKNTTSINLDDQGRPSTSSNFVLDCDDDGADDPSACKKTKRNDADKERDNRHMQSKRSDFSQDDQGRPSTSSNLVFDGENDGFDDFPARKKASRIDASEEGENSRCRSERSDFSQDEQSDKADGAVSIKSSESKDGKKKGEVKGNEGLRFCDLVGMESVLEEVKMELIVPLYHPELPRWLGVRPMSGILLHGPPGCRKTKLAHAIANETGLPFYKVSATELVSSTSGRKRVL